MAVLQEELTVGDLVWGKMKGYPHWPGKIIEVPPSMKDEKKEKTQRFVYFFGSKDYCYMAISNLEKFNAEANAKYTKSKKGGKKFILALEEMKFPNLVPNLAEDERNGEEEDDTEESEQDEEMEKKNSPKQGKKAKETKKKAKTGARKSSVKSAEIVTEEENAMEVDESALSKEKEKKSSPGKRSALEMSSTGDEEDVDETYEEDVKKAKRMKKLDVSKAHAISEEDEEEYKEPEDEEEEDEDDDSNYSDYEDEGAKKKTAKKRKTSSAKSEKASKKVKKTSEKKKKKASEPRKASKSASASKKSISKSNLSVNEKVSILHLKLQKAIADGPSKNWDIEGCVRVIEKLAKLNVSVDCMKDTGIGRTVKRLCKLVSNDPSVNVDSVKAAARSLYENWKALVTSKASPVTSNSNLAEMGGKTTVSVKKECVESNDVIEVPQEEKKIPAEEKNVSSPKEKVDVKVESEISIGEKKTDEMTKQNGSASSPIVVNSTPEEIPQEPAKAESKEQSKDVEEAATEPKIASEYKTKDVNPTDTNAAEVGEKKETNEIALTE
eukprot:Nk52_evm17s260 gene=Nk52_evmTU17s260